MRKRLSNKFNAQPRIGGVCARTYVRMCVCLLGGWYQCTFITCTKWRERERERNRKREEYYEGMTEKCTLYVTPRIEQKIDNRERWKNELITTTDRAGVIKKKKKKEKSD